ncbi:SMI1/KNR4 family protein [Metabacillus niabensis]|uniref:SMI1/KNR4 family protein n=1 Tax=Metabacillus niabensis TaxID=324854 RepID=UPI001CFAF5DD|nr:SMI1/KNR4 family protein [Metabacillus niabensis]
MEEGLSVRDGELFLKDAFKDGVTLMWKNYISSVSKEYSFKPPVTNIDINQIIKELNVELPKKLFELLSETNGVFDRFDCPLIWSTSQIVKDNDTTSRK